MNNGTIGEIRGFAGNFAPRDWAYCAGQLLAISQNSALFSILGTTYGGDGRTSFGLPDLRGRTPVHAGTGPGLSPIVRGQRGGIEYINLNTLYMPNHSHAAAANIRTKNGDGDKRPSGGNYLAGDSGVSMYRDGYNTTLNANAATVVLGSAGSSTAIPLRNPYLGIQMIICMFGTYPSRS